jgi:hypothetical protein
MAGDARDDDAPTMSRTARREEKRRLHEAHKKARDIDKANDKKEKKARKYDDRAQKKTEKGKTDKAQKKTDKAARRRNRVR